MAQEGAISLIAALAVDSRAIGKGNDLLWRIPDDLARFKALTLGHPVIMGRKTWESLPKKFRPLPGRTNFVVTRSGWYEADGAKVVHSFPEALSYAREAPGGEEVFVIGGGELYSAALPFAGHLYLTLIEDEKEADVFFPAYEAEFANETSREAREWNGLNYTWVTLER